MRQLTIYIEKSVRQWNHWEGKVLARCRFLFLRSQCSLKRKQRHVARFRQKRGTL